MKTRAQIYSHEASGILRDISTYGVLTQKQILGLYPQKDEQRALCHEHDGLAALPGKL